MNTLTAESRHITVKPRHDELAARFRRGEEQAIAEVWQQNSSAMFATAFVVLRDRELAADAVQQAFVQAWRKASSLDPTRRIQPWLCTITRRAAIDVHRRERHRLMTGALEEQFSDPAVTGPSFEETWQAWQVRIAVDQLHPDERDVLHLAYFVGMTQSEISKCRGIALGTVKSRTARALRNLSQQLCHIWEIHPS